MNPNRIYSSIVLQNLEYAPGGIKVEFREDEEDDLCIMIQHDNMEWHERNDDVAPYVYTSICRGYLGPGMDDELLQHVYFQCYRKKEPANLHVGMGDNLKNDSDSSAIRYFDIKENDRLANGGFYHTKSPLNHGYHRSTGHYNFHLLS